MVQKNILNITSFYGVKDQVIENYITYLNNLIYNNSLDEIQKSLILEYISKLKYFQKISDTSNPEFSKFIDFINKEYLFLKEKFPYLEIEFQGRIKSLISTDSKIKKDLKQALLSGEDLKDITLKDILAYRYIINIPENLKLDENASAQICYDFATAQIEFNLQNGNSLIEAKHFNSIVDEEKLKKYSLKLPEINFENKYSKYIKDYIKYPKDSLYQALHVRYFLNNIPFETQIKTQQMHEFAEYGAASHKYYKPRSSFNIHKVPQELGFIKKDDGYKIDFLPTDESIKLYYGYSFEDKFGITFQSFTKSFSPKEQNLILKGKLQLENGILVPSASRPIKQRIKKSDISLSELLEICH